MNDTDVNDILFGVFCVLSLVLGFGIFFGLVGLTARLCVLYGPIGLTPAGILVLGGWLFCAWKIGFLKKVLES